MKKVLLRILPYVKHYKILLLLCVIICLIDSAINIFVGDYIKNIIDHTLKNHEPIAQARIFVGIFIILACVVITFLTTYSSGYLSVHICKDLRKRIANKLQRLSIKKIEDEHSGEFISRIHYDLPIIQRFFSESIPSFVYYPVVLIGTIVYLALIDWRLLLITTCLIPLTIYIASLFGKPVKKYAKAMSESSAKTVSTAKDIVSGIYISKAYNLQNILTDKYSDTMDKYIGHYYLYEKKLAILTPFSMIVRLVPFFFCFIFGGYFATKGYITTGSLYAFIFLLNNLVNPMSQIPSFISEYRTFDASLTRLEDILNETEERTDVGKQPY